MAETSEISVASVGTATNATKPPIGEPEYEFILCALVHFRVPDRFEAAQEVALVALHAPFAGGSFRAWLYVIARNVAARHHQEQKKYASHDPVDALLEFPDTGLNPEEQLRRKQDLALLEELVSAIKPERRRIYLDHVLLGMTDQELVEAFALPEGTVKTRLRLAREDLAEAVKRYCARQSRRGVVALPFIAEAVFAQERARQAAMVKPVLKRLLSRSSKHSHTEGREGGATSGFPLPPLSPPPLPLKPVLEGLLNGIGGAIAGGVITAYLLLPPSAQWLSQLPDFSHPGYTTASADPTVPSTANSGAAPVRFKPDTSHRPAANSAPNSSGSPTMDAESRARAWELIRAAESALARGEKVEAAHRLAEYDRLFGANDPFRTIRQRIGKALR